MKKLISLLFVVFFFASNTLLADSGAGGSGEPDPVPNHIFYLVKSEQYAAANKKLKHFVRREKKSFAGWSLLAKSQFKAGELKASLKSHVKAVKLQKTDLEVNQSLGQLYLALGDQAKANAQLDRLRQLCGECDHTVALQSDIQRHQSS